MHVKQLLDSWDHKKSNFLTFSEVLEDQICSSLFLYIYIYIFSNVIIS